ncbi:MAG: universal stress protein [Anoxybacillus mongoliensis]|nr:universal stress protein [Anoxybacillus mongoliensis]
MRTILFFCLSLILIFTSAPMSSFAYSYGDPNEEAVAEAYKEMVAKVQEKKFDEVKAIYETVQKEIDMHMGPEPSTIILEAIKNKDADTIVSAMQKVLVLNVARRLENVEKNFDHYDTSKRLLAKAFATYKALSPIVQQKDAELDKKLKQQFDVALQSLGNPGLFGVGKKESNIDQFKESKKTILQALQDQFELEDVETGHFTEEDLDRLAAAKKKEWTDLSDLKNWIPIIVIIGVIIAVVVYAIRKRK